MAPGKIIIDDGGKEMQRRAIGAVLDVVLIGYVHDGRSR